MDYSRRRVRYQLNVTSHADDAAAVRKVMQAGQSKETRSRNLQKQAAAAAGRKVTAEEIRKRKADYKKRHKYYHETFGKEKKKKNRVAVIVVVVIFAAVWIVNVMEDRAMREDTSQHDDSWYSSSSESYEFDDSVLEGLEDYYSTSQEKTAGEDETKSAVTTEPTQAPVVTEELPAAMPAEGEAYSVELSPGRYVGGQQLPAGTYEISLASDEYAGTVILTDMKNGVFESAFLAVEEEYGGERTVRDYQLFEGGVLEIGSGGILVTASTQNAQMDTLQEGMPNPLTESFDLTYGSRLEVGADIPAGTYDARYLSGSGTLEITDQDGSGYSGVLLTDSLTDDEKAQGYRNLLLEEGRILSVADYSTEDFRGQLIPSEIVYETESET